MTASDVVLDDQTLTAVGDKVSILSPEVFIGGRDLILDSPERRGSDHTQKPRRALVHDQGDGLTVNFGKDYPRGVTLSGEVTIEIPKTKTVDPIKGPFGHGPGKDIGGIKVPGEAESLGDAIWRLRGQVQALEARLAAVEGK